MPLPNGGKRRLLLRDTSDELHVLDFSSGHMISTLAKTDTMTIGGPKGHHECTSSKRTEITGRARTLSIILYHL